jgi:uncharacterized protein (TIGR00251 family)
MGPSTRTIIQFDINSIKMPQQLSHTSPTKAIRQQQPVQDKTVLPVHVTPSAKKNAVTVFKENEWHIKIAAPPIDGNANDKLIEFLSSVLDLRKNALFIIKGQTSRRKLVRVESMSSAEIETRLSALVSHK